MQLRHQLTSVAAALVVLALVDMPQPLLAQAGKNAKDTKGAATLVWPLPPEKPRLKYLAQYHGAIDFKKKPGRWKSALLGNAPDTVPADMFVKPYAVAVGPDGRVYVTDTAARRVFVVDREHGAISFIGDRGNVSLTKPVGIAIDERGFVYVSDATLKRVFAFSQAGNVALAIGRDGEFDSPAGLAIDRIRHVLYVVDSSRHQIVCYSSVDGTRIRTIGTRGSELGEFNFPTNLAVSRDGLVYVADTLNFRIQVFDPDGKPVRAFGTLGDAPGTFNRPKGVAVDSEGHVYVADSAFDNFQVFDAQGQLLLFVGHGGGDAGQFVLPAGIYVDERDQVYVADQGNARVQVFQYLRTEATK